MTILLLILMQLGEISKTLGGKSLFLHAVETSPFFLILIAIISLIVDTGYIFKLFKMEK